MTADSQRDIQHLKAIGRICAEALRVMRTSVRAGMTTRELDDIGRAFLEAEGARSAPQAMYKFPGATCISVSPVIAHGIPNEHVLSAGELIHIDVSAELDGYYADTGASMVVARHERHLEKLLEATKATLKKSGRWFWPEICPGILTGILGWGRYFGSLLKRTPVRHQSQTPVRRTNVR